MKRCSNPFVGDARVEIHKFSTGHFRLPGKRSAGLSYYVILYNARWMMSRYPHAKTGGATRAAID
jgi:hypothetical protein